jgi:LPS sulfotransferase NodH
MTDTAKSPRRFVVLTSQRTGSTLLVRSLDSSPDILCAGEIFHTGEGIQRVEYRYPRKFIGSAALGKLRDAFVGQSRVRGHLSRFYEAGAIGVKAVGFKLMISQVRQLPPILPELIRAGAHLLFLYRDDSLAAALSYCRAKATRVFHSDRVSAAGEQAEIHVSVNEFERMLRKCQRDRAQLLQWHSARGGYLMRYEDMVSDWERFVENLGFQLGIPGLRVPMGLQKLSSDGSSTRIVNEAELLARFRDA